MSFTASGVVILAIAAYVFLFRPRNLMYYLFFFAPFSATAIANLTALGYKSGGVGVTPAIVLTLLMCTADVIYGNVAKASRLSLAHLVVLAAILLFTLEMLGSLLFNSALVGMTSFQLTQSVYLGLGIVTCVVLSLKLVHGRNLETAIEVSKWSAVFVSFWGLLQYALYNLGVPYPSMLFNNSMSDAADMFDQNSDGFMRIASVAVEPSFFAASMLHFAVFGATLVMMEPRFRTRAWLFPVGLTVLTLVISTATTAYVGLAVFALLMLLRRPLLTLAVGTPLLAFGAFCIALFPKLQNAILMMTVNKSSTNSYLDRVERMRESMDQFYASPIFGQGWSKTFNFNALTTMLANCGLVGTAIAVGTGVMLVAALGMVKPDPSSRDGWRLSAYAAGAQNMLIVAFACAVSSGLKYVVLDDACFGALAIALLTRLDAARVAPWRPLRVRPPALLAGRHA